MKRYDAIMIGWGKGAKTLAAAFAKQGKHVAMIEKSNQMYGGTCINVGCIPSKSLIVGTEKYAYDQAVARKRTLVGKLRNKNFHLLEDLHNVDVYTAEGSFVNEHEVRVKNEEIDEVIYGELIFINTGSTSIIPNIAGLQDTKHVYTSDLMMDEEQLPKRLAILGGGYIGLEFSSMYARYGAQVSVLEHGERLVKREDEDIATAIQSVLENQGVRFYFNTSVTKVHNDGEEVVITYEKDGKVEELRADALLLATGRKANTASLQLENAHVEVDARGTVKVDEHLRTSQPHIYAMGDVKGGLQFTYISLDDYRIVQDDLFGEQKRTTNNRGNIPYSVFISPTFSRVGMSEQEAIAAGYQVKTNTMPAASIPRANVDEKTEGLLKAVVNAETKEILGCVLFCEASEEIINFVQLAMNLHLTSDEIKNHIFTHPTKSEGLNDLFAPF